MPNELMLCHCTFSVEQNVTGCVRTLDMAIVRELLAVARRARVR